MYTLQKNLDSHNFSAINVKRTVEKGKEKFITKLEIINLYIINVLFRHSIPIFGNERIKVISLRIIFEELSPLCVRVPINYKHKLSRLKNKIVNSKRTLAREISSFEVDGRK